MSKKNAEHDFLNISPQGDYHSSERFLGLILENCLDMLDSEVRDSLGMVDERSYEDYIARYIHNINSHIKGEKIKNNVTGKFEQSDMYFITEFEININLNEDPERFRSALVARLGAFSLDNPNTNFVYCEVYEDLVRYLQESFRKEQKKILKTINKNLVIYLNEMDRDSLRSVDPKIKNTIDGLIDSLQKKYNYSHTGAITSLQYLLRSRYGGSES